MKRRTVRGRSERATCPDCGRIIAAVADRHALLAGAGLSWLLHPHNIEPGRACRGWRVYRDALVAKSSSPDPLIDCQHWEPGHVTKRTGCTSCESSSYQPHHTTTTEP